MRAIDIAGARFGRLTAIKRDPNQVGRHTKWLCKCDCGTTVSVNLDALRRGASTSCGCFRSEQIAARSLTHGHKIGRVTSRTLKSYEHAKGRCFNPKNEKYPIYGGRGITMCARWAESFANFLEDMGECPDGLTIDRIDVNGNYEPGNCRWASKLVQAGNRTTNIYVEHNGEKIILKEFARLMGVDYSSLHARVKYKGQTPHEAANALK